MIVTVFQDSMMILWLYLLFMAIFVILYRELTLYKEKIRHTKTVRRPVEFQTASSALETSNVIRVDFAAKGEPRSAGSKIPRESDTGFTLRP